MSTKALHGPKTSQIRPAPPSFPQCERALAIFRPLFLTRAPEQGFALVPVLWIAGLLAVLAASFSLSVRTTLRTTANIVEAEKAEALADAGVALAVLDLTRNRRPGAGQRRFPTSGAIIGCELSDEGRLLISVNDQ